MKAKQLIITTAAIIALAAIGASVLVLREPGTAAVPTDETSAVKKVTPKKPVKKTSVSTRVKPIAVSLEKAAKPTLPEGVGTAAGKNTGEPPKADGADAEKKAKDDNPFPRYLDMFKSDPAALAAEFEKEAEKERVSLAKVREHAIEALKLNAEQVAVFEKALDDLRAEGTQITEEWVELIKSGQLNYEDDGSIFTDNRLLGQRVVAAREKAMREMAEKLYGQLALDGVSDRDKQAWLFIAASRTVNSIECYEPFLQVYDKVYKNMGFGNGIFSWCRRQRQLQKK